MTEFDRFGPPMDTYMDTKESCAKSMFYFIMIK